MKLQRLKELLICSDYDLKLIDYVITGMKMVENLFDENKDMRKKNCKATGDIKI